MLTLDQLKNCAEILKSWPITSNLKIQPIPEIINLESQELKQFRFPKSKKKRIRKKWSKRKQNFKYITVQKMLKIGDTIFVSRKVFDTIAKNPLEI
jgi:hypothetical protein